MEDMSWGEHFRANHPAIPAGLDRNGRGLHRLDLHQTDDGLYGKLFDSPIGMIGFGLVIFWLFTAIFADFIITHDPLAQVSGMKNKVPGTPLPDGSDGFSHYLLGGDNLARDVFSRMVMGARSVMQIAPAATLFAFMVGITLGLPAGYFGGRLDTSLSFIANLVLAFPVILLFYLLVTKEIVETGIPTMLAAVLFLFPIAFLWCSSTRNTTRARTSGTSPSAPRWCLASGPIWASPSTPIRLAFSV